MRFSCGETLTAMRERKRQWHKWFAWHPVEVCVVDDKVQCAWLQYVERKSVYIGHYAGADWDHEYRLIGSRYE